MKNTIIRFSIYFYIYFITIGCSQTYNFPDPLDSTIPSTTNDCQSYIIKINQNDVTELHSSAAFLRFHLNEIANNAKIIKATLYLRRYRSGGTDEDGPKIMTIYNINKGLKIKELNFNLARYQIMDCELSNNEDELWGYGISFQVTVFGQNSRYNRTITGSMYKLRDWTIKNYGDFFTRNFMMGEKYINLLFKMNPKIYRQVSDNVSWDQFDITEFVVNEYNGDKSLSLILCSDTDGSMPNVNYAIFWYNNNRSTYDCDGEFEHDNTTNTGNYDPYLFIEYQINNKIDESSNNSNQTIKESETNDNKNQSKSENNIDNKNINSNKDKSIIYFSSNPSDAKVYIDGSFVGMTDENKELEINSESKMIKIAFEKSGYKHWTIDLKVKPNSKIPIKAILEKDD